MVVAGAGGGFNRYTLVISESSTATKTLLPSTGTPHPDDDLFMFILDMAIDSVVPRTDGILTNTFPVDGDAWMTSALCIENGLCIFCNSPGGGNPLITNKE